MDWTGAHVTGMSLHHSLTLPVVRSSQPSHVHLHGIVVQETHDTFAIIADAPHPTPPKCIPKHNTVFRLALPLDDGTLACEVHGNQLRYSLPTRITRKHKARKTIEF